MFFTLSKIIDFILLPISWIIACSLIAIFSKKRNWQRLAGLVGLFILLIGSNSFVVNSLYKAYETPQTILSPQAHYPVAVVLGGGMIHSKLEDPNRINVAESADRCLQAALLFKSGKIDQILITGGNTSIGKLKIDQANETMLVKQLLVDLGIPADSIIVETHAKNTHENALNTKKILTSRNIKSPILLITSAYHMRRAAACFAHEKIAYIPYAVDNKKKDSPLGVLDYIFPSERELHKLAILIHEMSGYLIYLLMGYA